MFGMNEQQRYDLFAKVIKDAVDPAMRELADLKTQVGKLSDDRVSKADFNVLRAEIQTHANNVYSRELVDSKFSDLRGEIAHTKTELEKTANSIGQAQESAAHAIERKWSRGAICVSVGYILLQALPHLVAAFGHP